MRVALRALILLALSSAVAHADELGAQRGDFRAAQKSDSFKDRQDAYVVMASYDGADAAEEVLRALVKEDHPAVVYTGVRTLAGMKSTGAQDVYRKTLEEGKAKARLYVLMALDSMSAPGLEEALQTVMAGKDSAAAAQAALALGRRRTLTSLPHLLPLLRHKVWQVRRAAGIAVLSIASPPPVPPAPGSTEKPVTPPTPRRGEDPRGDLGPGGWTRGERGE